MTEEEKAGWIPPEKRINEDSRLDPSTLSYLVKLVELGEGLMVEGSAFSQAQTLIKHGYAKVVQRYSIKRDSVILLFMPTDKGRKLAITYLHREIKNASTQR